MIPKIHSVPIIAEDELERVNCGRAPAPSDWSSRCLYIGEVGARNWLDILSEPTYTLHGQDVYSLQRNRLAAVERAGARTMVSLGPGDGEHDIDLVRVLRAKEPRIAYIPVDICRGLLDVAIVNLRNHVNIPVGILCDFEAVQPSLHNALDQHAQRPILFSLLGGTIGNLDLGERRFFAGMRELMQAGDYFLLDIPLAGPAWTARDDPRLDKAKYSDPFQRFLAGGLAHRDPVLKAKVDRGWFDERIECGVSYDGVIDGTKVITVRDQHSGWVLLRFRRYDWDSIRRWFRGEGFHLDYGECSLTSPEDKFGMGVVLLTKGKSG